MTSPAKSGYIFQAEIADSLRKIKDERYGKGMYWERIQDTKSFGVRCKKCRAPIYPNLILPKQPADFKFIIYGACCYLEAKSTRNETSYNIQWIKPHQMSMGYDIIDAGGQYYFLICRRVPFDMKLYALTPEQLTTAMLRMEYKTMIRWEDVAKNAEFTLTRETKTGTWDIGPLVAKVKNGHGKPSM